MPMPTSKKGFDPLSSLFDVPAPGPVLPEIDDPGPVFDAAADLPEPSHVKKPRATPVVPPVALGPAIESGAASRPGAPSGPDPAMLARLIGRAAQAKAGAPRPSSSPLSAALPPPGVAAAAPGSVPSVPDRAALARAVARAALANAGAPKPAPGRTAAPPSRVAPPEAPKPAIGASRLFAAPPPKRSMSVDEAMAAARVDEEKAKGASAKSPAPSPAAVAPSSASPARPAADAAAAASVAATPVSADDLADVVSSILHAGVPGLGPVYVANALRMDDRGLLTALWRAHRARFASVGEIERAVACGAVIRAVGSVAIGHLVAAHAVTDKTDYLIWVDLITRQPVAAFADARAWFASE